MLPQIDFEAFELPERPQREKHRSAGKAYSPGIFIFRECIAYVTYRRLFDIVVAICAFIAVGPLLIIVLAIIFLEDGEPLLIQRQRVGRFGRLFYMYELRTAAKAAATRQSSLRMACNEEATHVGRWLRVFSLQKLPQLINVILGDMTFVGPRPDSPTLVHKYKPWQHLRHLAKPGIVTIPPRSTYGISKNELTESMLCDIDYVARATMSTDIRIVARQCRIIVLRLFSMLARY